MHPFDFDRFQRDYTKKGFEWFHRGILVKDDEKLCATDTTKFKFRIDPANKTVVGVRLLLTMSSAFGDSPAPVMNQWFTACGHNECAEQPTTA